MNGIVVPRLFKYVKPKTGITILENKTLQWSIPASFNDPFEFKNPFAYGFEWDELLEVALQEYAKILTQPEEPVFDDRNEIAPDLKERRKECKGKHPNEVIPLLRPRFRPLVEQGKETAAQDEAHWREREKTFLLLCPPPLRHHTFNCNPHVAEPPALPFA